MRFVPPGWSSTDRPQVWSQFGAWFCEQKNPAPMWSQHLNLVSDRSGWPTVSASLTQLAGLIPEGCKPRLSVVSSVRRNTLWCVQTSPKWAPALKERAVSCTTGSAPSGARPDPLRRCQTKEAEAGSPPAGPDPGGDTRLLFYRHIRLGSGQHPPKPFFSLTEGVCALCPSGRTLRQQQGHPLEVLWNYLPTFRSAAPRRRRSLQTPSRRTRLVAEVEAHHQHPSVTLLSPLGCGLLLVHWLY